MLRNWLRRLQITLNDSNLFYIEEVLASERCISYQPNAGGESLPTAVYLVLFRDVVGREPHAGVWSETEHALEEGRESGSIVVVGSQIADAQVSHRGGQSAGGAMVQPAETKDGRNDRAGRLCGPVEGSRDRADGHLDQVHDQARQNVDHLGQAAHRNAGANPPPQKVCSV
jgi:hypothetical protein